MAIPAVLLAAACAADGGGGARTVVRDSSIVHEGVDATIRIIENATRSDALPVWTLSGEPLIDLGGADGPEDQALFRVSSAYRLSDGRIIVADGGSSSLKVFDAAGRPAATIGRQGEGPGEFRGISHFALRPADSLAVWDFAQARLTVFDHAGAVGREVRIGSRPSSPRSDIIGVFADGTLLSRDFIRLDGTPVGLLRHEVGAFHLDATGSVLDTLPPSPAGEAWFIDRDDGGFSAYTPPFARATEVVASGSRIITGDTEHAGILVSDADGTPRLIIRWIPERRRISDADIEAARREALGDDPSDTRRTDVQRMFDGMPARSLMPAFGALRVDTGGNLWVMDYRTAWDEGDATWTVFDPDGAMLARLSMPGRFLPTHIGPDFVLGIARDDLDVERVRLYGLQRGSD